MERGFRIMEIRISKKERIKSIGKVLNLLEYLSSGEAIGAISITGPESRFTLERMY